jgi:hypothetical protein
MTEVVEGLPLAKALLAPTARFSLHLGGDAGFTLEVPEFGRDCALEASAAGSADGGRVSIVVSSSSGSVGAVFEARAGQPPFPEGFYTVMVHAATTVGEHAVTLEGRPEFDLTAAQLAELEGLREAVRALGIEAELNELSGLGGDLLLIPLRRAGIAGAWAKLVKFHRSKPEVWELTLKCGVLTTACVLGVLAAPATSGMSLAAALAACGPGAFDCKDLIEELIDP